MVNSDEFSDFEKDLINQLKDPEFASAYINELLSDPSKGSQERLLLGLRRTAQAMRKRTQNE